MAKTRQWALALTGLILTGATLGRMSQSVAQDEPKRARLEQKYGHVRGLPAAEMENRILAAHTVSGAPFFSGVEIQGTTLYLWLARMELFQMQNFSFLADVTDAFSVWCACVGTTKVGMDLAHLGQGKHVMGTFTHDGASGRSRLTR
jgi:hypothetical protein